MLDVPRAASDALNAADAAARLSTLAELVRSGRRGAARDRDVNNHVHTTFSFSPYSPTAAAERADASGLCAVGIMDHDTAAGAHEMREAGKILGIAVTTGVELRVSARGTGLEGRMINNPDSPGIMYVMIHGIPKRSVPMVNAFLNPVRASRERRCRAMTEAVNGRLRRLGVDAMDFESEVLAASQSSNGGTVTERHMLFSAAQKIVQSAGRGEKLPLFLRDRMGIALSGRLEGFIRDEGNPFLLYDLLGVLKSSFLPEVFIQPDGEECVHVARAVRLAEEAGAIPCYGYLGDVADSPTGDKKPEVFEDAYLPELVSEVKKLGFRAIAYMPPRNTMEQLRRVRGMCASHGLMEISGVDINSPRQSFNCPEILSDEFSHLIVSTWALIAHENLVHIDPRYGLFHADNPLAGLPLTERISRYAALCAPMDWTSPEEGFQRARTFLDRGLAN
jgi:hypothetical protein